MPEQGLYIMRVAAELVGMHPQTLRKYEQAGLVKPPRTKGLRLYRQKDIETLMDLKRLKKQGLNIAGIKEVWRLTRNCAQCKEGLNGHTN